MPTLSETASPCPYRYNMLWDCFLFALTYDNIVRDSFWEVQEQFANALSLTAGVYGYRAHVVLATKINTVYRFKLIFKTEHQLLIYVRKKCLQNS